MPTFSDRLVCPSCGANNFNTVSQCWRCGAALNPISQTSAPHAPNQPPYAADRVPPAKPMQASLLDEAAANRSAMWMGLLFPYFGLPIGMAFIMCGDPFRIRVGRVCIFWSMISGVIQTILFMLAGAAFISSFGSLGSVLKSQLHQQSLGGGGLGGGLGP